jgi:hypothetical protein
MKKDVPKPRETKTGLQNFYSVNLCETFETSVYKFANSNTVLQHFYLCDSLRNL